MSGRTAAAGSCACASLLIGADRLVTGAGQDAPGWLCIIDAVICASGSGVAPGPVDNFFETIVPGFVDSHVHGAVGVDFATLGQDPSTAIDYHARAGSTSLVASIATGEWAGTLDRLRELAPLVAAGRIAGLHLEGPYLSHNRRGAHDPALLSEPDATEIAAALNVAGGALIMVTIAPELPGALNAITQFVARLPGYSTAVFRCPSWSAPRACGPRALLDCPTRHWLSATTPAWWHSPALASHGS